METTMVKRFFCNQAFSPPFLFLVPNGQEVQRLVIPLPASDWAQVGQEVAAWNLGLNEDSAQQGKPTTQAALFAMSWGYDDLDEPMTRCLQLRGRGTIH